MSEKRTKNLLLIYFSFFFFSLFSHTKSKQTLTLEEDTSTNTPFIVNIQSIYSI